MACCCAAVPAAVRGRRRLRGSAAPAARGREQRERGEERRCERRLGHVEAEVRIERPEARGRVLAENADAQDVFLVRAQYPGAHLIGFPEEDGVDVEEQIAVERAQADVGRLLIEGVEGLDAEEE